MKKILSKAEEEKKKKRNQVIVGIVLVGLMVLSTIGYALQTSPGGNGNTGQNSPDKFSYNGFEFSYLNGIWVMGNFAFRYNPSEVPDIGDELKDATYYQGKPLYIYSEHNEAESEIKINLGQISERIQPACPKGAEFNCSENSPVKTCEDNFIIIKKSAETQIRQDNNCVYIEGSDEDIVKLADQFLFKILKIR